MHLMAFCFKGRGAVTVRGGGRWTESSQECSGEQGRGKGRGELSTAQGTHPTTAFSLKLQGKPHCKEAKPLKSLISCGKCSRGRDLCRSQYTHQPTSARAWGTENGSSPRAQGVRREVGGKGGPGSPVDSAGSCLVQLKAPGASLPCTALGLFAFFLWLLQARAQQVTQTLQSPTHITVRPLLLGRP